MFSFPHELYNNVSSSQKNIITVFMGITLFTFCPCRGVVILSTSPFSCLSSEISEPSISPETSTVPPTSASNQQKEKKKRKKDPSKGRWVEGITSEGYHYYYDLITGGKSCMHRTVENGT